MSIFVNAIPLLIAFGPFFLATAAIVQWKKRSAIFLRNNPLNRDMLRSPGETLRAEVEEVNLDITGYLTVLITMPLLLYSMLVSMMFFNGASTVSTQMIVFYALVGIACIGYLAYKIVGHVKRKRNLTLGLEAELSVGQELNELIRDGAWVFHDFPANGFNIDHVVISTKGVLAIETKARSKPTNGDGKSTGWEVIYDGTSLAFPGWTESEPLAQAARQAEWLQQWLNSALGESVAVKPILVLPGWFVKLANPKGIFVFNGKKPQVLFQYSQEVLSPTLVSRIVHQIDQRCRNIKPT
ncbi:MAG: nuclease-related domain-containing protein [Gallionella sp.]|nr:nuclease-related domain-containing protein [Gallionella sp.]